MLEKLFGFNPKEMSLKTEIMAGITTFLTMQASRLQDTTFRISFSREELASYLCVNRSALSHELSVMQQEGLITFRKNVFTLHKI